MRDHDPDADESASGVAPTRIAAWAGVLLYGLVAVLYLTDRPLDIGSLGLFLGTGTVLLGIQPLGRRLK